MKLRNITLTINDFGDFELLPLFRLAQAFSEPSSAINLSQLMRECFLSLRSIYGDAITQFWDDENSRLKLHSAELAILTQYASKYLESNTTYQSSINLTLPPDPKEQASKGFAQAVRERAAEPVLAPVQHIDDVVANQQRQREIDELEKRIALLKSE